MIKYEITRRAGIFVVWSLVQAPRREAGIYIKNWVGEFDTEAEAKARIEFLQSI